MKTCVCLLLTFSLVTVLGAQPALPIDELYLYKNGMAYVVRNGEITEPLTLSFHRDDFNDVLKNLIAFNPRTGVPYPLGYTTAIPGRRLLERFPFDLRLGGIAYFLERMKGAQLEIEHQRRTHRGRLLGIESISRADGEDPPTEDHRLTLLGEDGRLSNFLLSFVESARLEDPALQEQLGQYLQLFRESYNQTAANLTIQPTPAAGPVRVAYVQQFPVWKTSYRLELGDTDRLQGWVQIDNPTGEAWDGVQLTLVSGAPVSFEMDLYEPLYTVRRSVPVPNRQVTAPVEYEEAVADQPRRKAAARESAFEAEFGRNRQTLAAPAEGVVAAAPPPPAPLQLVEAEAARAEDYFEYRFPFPVSLANRESALLPFLSRELEAETVSIYNAANHPNHPYNSVKFDNATGVPLEAGPVTVFQQGRYAGEAVLGYLNRGQEGLLSYGLDYEVSVSRQVSGQPEQVVRLTISNGVAYFFKESLRGTTYELRSNADRAKELLIEHPRDPSLKLKSPEADERTDSFYRFRVELQPDEQRELAVQEIVSSQSSLVLRRLERNEFLVYFSNLNLPGNLRRQLEEVAAATAELNRLEQQQRDLGRRYEQVAADQGRIRENLSALGKSGAEKQLSERYIRELSAQEDELDRLKEQREQLQRQIVEKTRELDRLVAQLSFEGPVR